MQCLLPFDCAALLRKCQLAYWIFNIVLYAFFSIVFEPAALILSCLLVCIAFAARFIYEADKLHFQASQKELSATRIVSNRKRKQRYHENKTDIPAQLVSFFIHSVCR